MAGVKLAALYSATNAIILGDQLAEKIGARIGANITVQTSQGARIGAHVVGFFHTGVRQVDEGTAYVLTRTGQILFTPDRADQTNSGCGSRTTCPPAKSPSASKATLATNRSPGRKRTRTPPVRFVIRNIIMYAVVGAILLVASFGTYNIVSTITHEKARDIAIMKSLGSARRPTVRKIFVVEALMIGIAGALAGFVLGYVLCLALGTIEIKNPFLDANRLPLAYSAWHYLLAGLVALVSSVAAGYMPARKAASVYPVDIIRGAT